jgi:hypothetical protein
MHRSVPSVEMRTIQGARGRGMEQHFLVLERQRRRPGAASLACLATAAAAAGKTKENPPGSGQRAGRGVIAEVAWREGHRGGGQRAGVEIIILEGES